MNLTTTVLFNVAQKTRLFVVVISAKRLTAKTDARITLTNAESIITCVTMKNENNLCDEKGDVAVA